MAATIQSYPPLGQITTSNNTFRLITAVLEIPVSQAENAWQVVLWHSIDGQDWAGVSLSRLSQVDEPQSLGHIYHVDTMNRLFFYGRVSFAHSVRFTFKFRCDPEVAWEWADVEHQSGDGYIIATSISDTPRSLKSLIPDLNSSWTVKSHISQTPSSTLWSLETKMPPASGDNSQYKNTDIGTPWGGFLRWFAVVRLSLSWLAPRHGKVSFDLDKDAVLSSFLSSGGETMVLLAVSGLGQVTSVLKNTPQGGICSKSRNDEEHEGNVVVLVGVSGDFDRAMAAVMYHARTLLESNKLPAIPLRQMESEKQTRTPQRETQADWYDGLGYCTWDGIGQELTERKLIHAMDQLAAHEVHITNLIIDDNWQSIDEESTCQDQRGWSDFEANLNGFPQGLKSTVSQLRQRHPNIRHVAVWHALFGYWGGIAPNGTISQRYKTIQVNRLETKDGHPPREESITVVAKDNVARLYADFYEFLIDAGVDAVKTDAQSIIDTVVGAAARRNLTRTYLDAQASASHLSFGGQTISSMSQFPYAIFHSHMARDRPASVVRNSDDFFPNEPTSHPWHVWANAHNSVFAQYLNILPDWDMFQTVHEYSGFHAAARCVSGGPIYITDVPGNHNTNLLGQITSLTPKGKTITLRPSVPGKSTHSYVGYNDNALLKVGSYHGASETGTPVLAIFNVSDCRLTEIIPITDFPGTLQSFKYVIRAYSSGRVSRAMKPGSPVSLISVSLDPKAYDILSVFPLTEFSGTKHGHAAVAQLGLLKKMTGCAAVLASSASQLENGRVVVRVTMKALGVFGVYISSLPHMTIADDFMVMIQGQAVPVETVQVSRADMHVLEVDVQKAWSEMKLTAQWRDEVEVGVYFSL